MSRNPRRRQIPKYPPLHEDASPRWAILSAHARYGDADLVYPAGQKAKYQKAFDRFASVFPDTFYVSERGRYWPDQATDNGRLLSAGYHNTGGYYRDDTALMQLILDKKGQDQLNRLWNEFDFVAHQTERTWVQYYFNQSGEVDGNINGPLSTESGSKRPVGHEVTDQFVILQMRDKYLARWAMDKEHNDPVAPKAFNWHFGLINATLRNLEKQHVAAEPKHLAALVSFAQRAYRRPLTANERADLLAYYKKLRSESAAQPRRRRARLHRQRADVAGLPLSLRPGDGRERQGLAGQARQPEAGPGLRQPALVGLQPGQPAELFPLGQHAGCRTAAACRGRRFAQARGAAG